MLLYTLLNSNASALFADHPPHIPILITLMQYIKSKTHIHTVLN